MNISAQDIKTFQEKIFSFYREHGRAMPWRDDTSAYAVFVSEVMLQQTQVSRVEKFFHSFCQCFPNFQALANSQLDELLLAWKGLGYNRRAAFMRQSAIIIQNDYAGRLPDDPAELVRLPGIGVNTAGSIAAYAYNKPTIFIETNIRKVFIKEFFPERDDVHDKDILPLVERTVAPRNARIWYWALMDYGVSLKEDGRKAARRSRHYSRQSEFVGSARQLRSGILKELATLSRASRASLTPRASSASRASRASSASRASEKGIAAEALFDRLKQELPAHPFNYDLLDKTLHQLQKEGLVFCEGSSHYRLEK